MNVKRDRTIARRAVRSIAGREFSLVLMSCMIACVGSNTGTAPRSGLAGEEERQVNNVDGAFVVRLPSRGGSSMHNVCYGGPECQSAGLHYPNVAPLDTSRWRSTGWCPPSSSRGQRFGIGGAGDEAEGGGGGRCPDDALAAWVSMHEEARRSPLQGRFLACKPMGGIGNFIAGTISCLAMAMATNRSLLLARPPKQADSLTKFIYQEPVETLFDMPIDVSLSPLGADVIDVPIITPDRNDPAKTGLELVDVRVDDLLCRNLSSSYTAPIAVMPAHLWLGILPDNHHSSHWFTQAFGRDEYGVSPVVSFLGPWLFRPKSRLLDLLSQLHLLASPGGALPLIAVQARVGHSGGEYLEDRPPAGSGPDFVRCAMSQTPTALRGKARGWLLAGDRGETRREMLEALAMVEGPIVSSIGAERLKKLAPDWLFSPGGAHDHPMDEQLAKLGFAVAVFASGSRAVVLADAPEDGTSVKGMEAALLEMWLLGLAAVLVVSENSTFWIPGVSFARGWGRGGAGVVGDGGGRWGGGEGVNGRRGVYVFTRGSRCYPLASEEPITDGGHRSRSMWRSPCWDDSQLNPGLTWLPVERKTA